MRSTIVFDEIWQSTFNISTGVHGKKYYALESLIYVFKSILYYEEKFIIKEMKETHTKRVFFFFF